MIVGAALAANGRARFFAAKAAPTEAAPTLATAALREPFFGSFGAFGAQAAAFPLFGFS